MESIAGMPEDWAEQAAERKNEDERRAALENELKVERLRRAKAVGPELIKALHRWLFSQTEKYNQLRGKDELETVYSFDKYRSPTGERKHEICVRRIDRKKSPLTIKYSEVTQSVEYDTSAGRGSLSVEVSDDGTGYFVDAYHRRYSVEELGKFLLDKFESGVF